MSFEELRRKKEILERASEILRVEPKDLPRVLKRFLKEIEEVDEKIQREMEISKSS